MRRTDAWIGIHEAALILSKRSGHDVSPEYVKLLGWRGKIDSKPRNKRENLYLRKDIEAYRVRKATDIKKKSAEV